MNKEPLDPRLEAYLALCRRMYERLQREGRAPWKPEDIRPSEPGAMSEDPGIAPDAPTHD